MIFIDQAGRDSHIALTTKSNIEQLRTQFKNLQLTEPFTARATYDPLTEGWVKDLIEEAFPTVTFSESIVGSSEFNGSLIGFRLSDRYFRAIAKIGFHYFLTQFPMLSGQESEFDEIRGFIITDTNVAPTPSVNQFVKRRTRQLIFPPYIKEGWLGHVLVAEIREGLCLAHFEPFVHKNNRLEARTISLGRVPVKGSQQVGHLHAYYPSADNRGIEKRGKYSGEAYALQSRYLNIESGEVVDTI